MDILFNSLQSSLCGGIALNNSVAVDFAIVEQLLPIKVTMIVRHINGTEYNRFDFSQSRVIDNYKIYTANILVDTIGIYYYRFELEFDEGLWFIGRNKNGQALRQDHLPEWQLTVYSPDYVTPLHIKGGLIYHIFVDRFNISGRVNFNKKGVLKKVGEDVTIHESDGSYLANDFYGGNFKGIVEKLDYLKELGVTVIYLSPIFESSSNHRYDTGDYMKVDSLLGTEDDFKELIDSAKSRGMGIMLDGVFNHTGADSIYFNKFNNYDTLGAYQSKKSDYYGWYHFSKFPKKYDCWWGITVVPTINKKSKGFRKMLLEKGGIIDKWTRLGIKGWRLDVVDELPIDWVNDIRKCVKNVNPNTLLIGEVWEDASIKMSYSKLRPYFNGAQLDGVMNYPFKNSIIDYVMGGSLSNFVENVSKIIEHYPKQSLDSCMTLLGTHDTPRIINVLSGITAATKAERQQIILSDIDLELAYLRLNLASSLQYFLPGVPSVYYGDEVGLEGYEDPLNRRFFPWDNINKVLLKHYRILGAMRTDNKDVMIAGIEFVQHSELLIIKRKSEKREILLVCNATKSNSVFTNDKKNVNLLDKKIYEIGEIVVPQMTVLILSSNI